MTVRIWRAPDWVLEDIPVDVPPPATTEAMAGIIDALPEPYRSVVEAVFWEQVPRRSLARRLGVERSAIERLYRESMARMLVALDEYTSPPSGAL